MSVTLDTEKAEARATRTVRESGNSTVVVIPPELLEAAGFSVGDDVEVVTDFETGDVTLQSVASEKQ